MVPLALAGLLLVLLVASILRLSVDVPLGDDWDIYYRLLDARARGDLLGELLAPANEHRVLVSRLVFLALLPFTAASCHSTSCTP